MFLTLPFEVKQQLLSGFQFEDLARLKLVCRASCTLVADFVDLHWKSIAFTLTYRQTDIDEYTLLYTTLRKYQHYKRLYNEETSSATAKENLQNAASQALYLISLAILRPDFDTNVMFGDRETALGQVTALQYAVKVLDRTSLSSKVLKALLRKNPIIPTDCSLHPFHAVILEKNVEATRLFLAEDKAVLGCFGKDSRSALDYALERVTLPVLNPVFQVCSVVKPRDRELFDLLGSLGARPKYYSGQNFRLALEDAEIPKHNLEDIIKLPSCSERVEQLFSNNSRTTTKDKFYQILKDMRGRFSYKS